MIFMESDLRRELISLRDRSPIHVGILEDAIDAVNARSMEIEFLRAGFAPIPARRGWWRCDMKCDGPTGRRLIEIVVHNDGSSAWIVFQGDVIEAGGRFDRVHSAIDASRRWMRDVRKERGRRGKEIDVV
jgi:hypothetical protein